ncbi:MAG: hypothetical protein KBD21_02290 [Candidatus Pacebacteria bacterium]|nr:hypothetical protein [Candidatus Paceibacterota bacterium]
MLVRIISIILRNTYTTDDLSVRVVAMRKYYDTLLYKKKNAATKVDLQDVMQNIDGDTTEAVSEWLHDFEKAALQPIVVYEALDTVEEEIVGLPTVTVYVPIRFSKIHVKRFGEWFRSNVQPNIMLNIRIDSSTAGGCSFVWQNVYHDFSFRYYAHKEHERIVSAFNSISTT